MRIGIDARLWNETGVGRYIRSLFRYLPSLDLRNEYVWFFRRKEYETISMPASSWKKVLADVPWHTVREQVLMPLYFYRENLGLLHVPYINFPVFYFRPSVVTIHDAIFDHYRSGKFSTLPAWLYFFKKLAYYFVTWNAIHRAKKVFTLSNDAKSELRAHYHSSGEDIIVTYESGELEDKKRTFVKREHPEIIRLQPYILYVGNAHPHKNVEALVQAVSYLGDSESRGKNGGRFRLVLVGDDEFFYPRLAQYIRDLGATGYVDVVGAVPNTKIAAWYYFASCLVTASKMEGFGIPPLEAMSVGCPVMVSDIPVFHEVYGKAAIYFNQNDPKDVANVIAKGLANKKLIKSQIARGYKQAAKYSWESMVRQTSAVYESCLSL